MIYFLFLTDGGTGAAPYKKKFKSLYILSKNVLMDIKISIIDIYYVNTARYLKCWCFLYIMNEKFIKNAKIEK